MLVLAVFAVVLLTLLAVGITAAVRVELLASRAGLDRMQSLFLAEAGAHEARAILLYDDVTSDSLFDTWGPLCDSPLDLPQRFGGGYYRVRVQDACGRIDINRVGLAVLTQLTDDPEVAAAILDWRDSGNFPEAGGAEQEYYAALPQPYLPRNGPLQTLGELLLVRGVTPNLFFGDEQSPGLADLLTVESVSLNTGATGERRIGVNEFRNWSESKFRQSVMSKLGEVLTMYEAESIWSGYAALVAAGTEYTSLGQLATAAGLSYETIARAADLLTVESDLWVHGKVNVNTAPPEVLAALPGSSREVAEALVAQREERPFVSRSEVAELLLTQAGGPEVLLHMIDHLTTKSSSFIIESMGRTETGRAFRTVRVLVRRRPDSVPIVRQAEQDWPLPALEEERLVIARR
ncbi:MAG: general secretion pathway protein GspK [Armatimonadota bacterium]|nr:MAG: general secretion pathway protein GspK [Armatimonadota bacterium]